MNGEPFGSWLARRMAELGLTQAELTRRVNEDGADPKLQGPNVSRWINGTVRISYDWATRIAPALQVPVDDALAAAGYQPTGQTADDIHPTARRINALLHPDSGLPDDRRTLLDAILLRLIEAENLYLRQRNRAS